MGLSITILVGAIYGYMYHKMDALLAETADLRLASNTGELVREKEKKFMETYKATAPKWSRLSTFFISSGEVVKFIEAVEALGPLTGSKVVLVNIDTDNLDSAVAGKEGLIRTKISAEGTWSSVMQVLSLAEILPYKIAINNIRLSVGESAPFEASSTKKATVAKPVWSLSFDLQASMLAVGTTTPVLK